MTRTRATFLAVVVAALSLIAVPPASAVDYQADAWIKLCGLSDNCSIDPPPHPWKGRDVHNATAARQTVAVRLEDGEGVRYWITVQNDGDQADTLTVQGCAGTRDFDVNAVLMGKHRRPDWRARNVTRAFLEGTLTFDLAPRAKKTFTLNIIAATHREGITYSCDVVVRSAGRWAGRDVVAGRMTTF